MQTLIHESDQWDYVERLLTESRGAAAKKLLGLLPTVQQLIVEDRFGELLFVCDQAHPDRLLGVAAVTTQCCCAKLLLQIVSKECSSDEVGRQAIAQAVQQYAKKNHCSLVFVHVPDSGEFYTQHNYYLERAESAHDRPTSELNTRTYVLSVENL
jgi:hypothetical protein